MLHTYLMTFAQQRNFWHGKHENLSYDFFIFLYFIAIGSKLIEWIKKIKMNFLLLPNSLPYKDTLEIKTTSQMIHTGAQEYVLESDLKKKINI